MIGLSHAHCHAFIIRCFFDVVRTSTLPDPIRDVFFRLARLHALSLIVRESGDFLHSNMMTSSQIDTAKELALHILTEVMSAMNSELGWCLSAILLLFIPFDGERVFHFKRLS